MNAKKIAKLAILTAFSIILVVVTNFPIFPQVAFLKYDAADIPILIGTFLYGPITGVFLTLIVATLQGLTVAASEGVIGMLMHFLATSSLVLAAGFIYRFHRSKKGAVVGLIFGTLAMIAMMIPLNYIFIPMLYGVPTNVVTGYLPFILLFNLVKAGINCTVTFLIYKAVGRLFREKLDEPGRKNRSSDEPKMDDEAQKP